MKMKSQMFINLIKITSLICSPFTLLRRGGLLQISKGGQVGDVILTPTP